MIGCPKKFYGVFARKLFDMPVIKDVKYRVTMNMRCSRSRNILITIQLRQGFPLSHCFYLFSHGGAYEAR